MRAVSKCVKGIPTDGTFARSLLYVIGAGVDTLTSLHIYVHFICIRQPIYVHYRKFKNAQKREK